jgi:hypothetical protein
LALEKADFDGFINFTYSLKRSAIMKFIIPSIAGGIVLMLNGCGTITVKHQVEPIYITMNVNVKVEKQLNDFFDFEDQGTSGSGGTESIPKEKTHKQ